MVFELFVSHDCSTWGPSLNSIPERFRDIPYAPYSKADKVGRVADWYEPIDQSSTHYQSAGQSGAAVRKHRSAVEAQAPTPTAFSYVHAEDEASFSLVDRTGSAIAASTATRATAKRAPAGGNAWGPRAKTGGVQTGGRLNQRMNNGGRRQPGSNWVDKHRVHRDNSVTVEASWKLFEEYQLQAFTKLSSTVNEAKVVGEFGTAKYYDRSIDRVSTKFEQQLKTTKAVYPQLTASEDPVFQSIADTFKLPNGKPLEGDVVFASAQLVAGLMTAPRSMSSWDIVVKKEERQSPNGSKHTFIYLDKREASCWDEPSVNETSAEPPTDHPNDKDNINSLSALSAEAANIQRHFLNHVAKSSGKVDFGRPNPFKSEGSSVLEMGYRYKMWDMRAVQSDDSESTPISLIARTEVHLSAPVDASRHQFFSVFALNEYFPVDPATGAIQGNYNDWRSKLDSQRGAVLANEMRNNAWKVARWTVESILSDAEQMKIGFVTRIAPSNPARGHAVLGTQMTKPTEFASQLNLDMQQSWGIIKSLVDIFINRPNGLHLLLKDGNEPKVRLYQLPEDVSLPGYGDQEDEDANEGETAEQ